jgi:hypothetical protein
VKGGQQFAKAYGTKVRCYGKHVEEHIGNLRYILRTHWELKGNIAWKKNPLLPPLPPKKSSTSTEGALLNLKRVLSHSNIP